jgi:cytochrome P450
MVEILQIDPSFTRNPLTVLRRLQAKAPVSRAVMWGSVPVWLVTGYEETRALLADPRLSKDRDAGLDLLPPNNSGELKTDLTNHMLQADPPDHTRLRKLVVKAFTARAVERLRSQIETIADELLDEFDTSAAVDLITSYAGPLPVRVISELLGIPVESGFRDVLAPFLQQSSGEQKQAATDELTTMLTALIADKRRHPVADLTSALTEATDDGERLSESELLATLTLLIIAGYDTTVNLIANGVHALLRHPSQLAALRADPTLVSVAVEEFLRFDSPVNISTIRFTTEAVSVGDVEIGPGQFVMFSLLAANHDPRHFAEADRLDITRKPNAHMAFGHGIHHCVGATLGRMEGRIAIARLLDRFEDLELATTGPIEYRDSTIIHGLTTLPVRCRSARSSTTRPPVTPPSRVA